MSTKTQAPKPRREWRKVHPTSLRHALELCKEYAREKRNMSVERLADAMGVADQFTLYRWLSTGKMPANLIRPYETACGVAYVSRWIAASGGKLLIDMPSGRKLTDIDLASLNNSFAAALQLLTQVYAGKADVESTIAALTAHMENLAWHRGNVAQYSSPELDFGGTEAAHGP